MELTQTMGRPLDTRLDAAPLASWSSGSRGAIDRDLKVERSVFGIGYTRDAGTKAAPALTSGAKTV
jgi:hypothetical protein